MGLIGTSTPIAYRHKRVKVSAPGQPVPDGDGGYTQGSAPLVPPEMSARIRPASRSDLERIAGNTVLPTATHLVSMPYHPQITTEATLLVEDYPKPDRLFKVIFVGNPDERDVDLELVCAEQVS